MIVYCPNCKSTDIKTAVGHLLCNNCSYETLYITGFYKKDKIDMPFQGKIYQIVIDYNKSYVFYSEDCSGSNGPYPIINIFDEDERINLIKKHIMGMLLQ